MFELALTGFMLLGGYMLAATVCQLIYLSALYLYIPFVYVGKKLINATENSN